MKADTVDQRLSERPFAFDFFQAVRLLEMIDPKRTPVGLAGLPEAEAVRFRALPSLNFPPSPLYALERSDKGPPLLTVSFFGLTGPSGVLPRHYTDLIVRLERERKGEERRALREWLDLFNHRLISLFHRAWGKYRFWIGYEREHRRGGASEDPFVQCLNCFVGLGTRGLSGRHQVTAIPPGEGRSRKLAGIEDHSLLFYAGLLAQRKRNAVGLEAILRDYFDIPIRVEQFVGQWLYLEPANQTRLGEENCELGMNALAGEKVLDYQGKFRVRLGPLNYERFVEFLPDRSATPESKAFFLLSHLTRFYVGPELDFDVRVVLRAEGVPECQLNDETPGPRLGWNTWLTSQQPQRDAEDVFFEGAEVTRIDETLAGYY